MRVTCPICGGSGLQNNQHCGTCNGYRQIDEQCQNCGGRGVYVCGSCGGAGSETCSMCGGAGGKDW